MVGPRGRPQPSHLGHRPETPRGLRPGGHGRPASLRTSGHTQGSAWKAGWGGAAGCWVLVTGRDPRGWISLTEGAPTSPTSTRGKCLQEAEAPKRERNRRPCHTDALGPAGRCRVGRVLCFPTPTAGADTRQALINTGAGQPLAATRRGSSLRNPAPLPLCLTGPCLLSPSWGGLLTGPPSPVRRPSRGAAALGPDFLPPAISPEVPGLNPPQTPALTKDTTRPKPPPHKPPNLKP